MTWTLPSSRHHPTLVCKSLPAVIKISKVVLWVPWSEWGRWRRNVVRRSLGSTPDKCKETKSKCDGSVALTVSGERLCSIARAWCMNGVVIAWSRPPRLNNEFASTRMQRTDMYCRNLARLSNNRTCLLRRPAFAGFQVGKASRLTGI